VSDETATFTRAHFKRLGGETVDFKVHFNPATLSYEITNNAPPEGGDAGKSKQFTALSTGKLSMDLVFDTTHDGTDVREKTSQVSRLMEPDPETRAPWETEFTWGMYRFVGVVNSYKETLDFFAPSGVPLRAAINLSMSSGKEQNPFNPTRGKPVTTSGRLEPAVVPPPAGGPAAAAARAGAPKAARSLAALNGEASLRFSSGASLTVPGSVPLKGAAGLSAGASAGGASGAFAASASGGMRLDPRALLPGAPTAGVSVGAGASFGVGGQARSAGSASLKADVGAGLSLAARIRFGEG
jgi:hypothetical protein